MARPVAATPRAKGHGSGPTHPGCWVFQAPGGDALGEVVLHQAKIEISPPRQSPEITKHPPAPHPPAA